LQAGAARRNIIAGTVGSVLEWYDFAVYGYLAPIIGRLFFPADDPVASLLAAFGVFAIGLLPVHAQIGPAAPILLVMMRIAEGLSVGGEYTGLVILLAEHAPPERRGYYAMWPVFGCIIGFLLGSGIGALTTGDEGGVLFVPADDRFDLRVHQRVEHLVDLRARDAEHIFDALCLQTLHQ